MMALILILAVAVIGIAITRSCSCMGVAGICWAIARGDIPAGPLTPFGKQSQDRALPTSDEVAQCEAAARAARIQFVSGIGWATAGVAAAAFAGFILGQGGL